MGNLENVEESKLNTEEPSILKGSRNPHITSLTLQFLHPPSPMHYMFMVFKVDQSTSIFFRYKWKELRPLASNIPWGVKICSFQMENQRLICKGGR